MRLKKYGKVRKFSAAAWKKRGLLPSSDELSQRLELFFNALVADLLLLVETNAPRFDLEKKLESVLLSLDPACYDTEEKEFICDLFSELAFLLGLNISVRLNGWLYGDELGEVAMEKSLAQVTEEVLKTVTQLCTECSSELRTSITQEREYNLIEDWVIIECLQCHEYNFMVTPPNIGTSRGIGYKFVECLWRDSYTIETAQERFIKLRNKKRKQLAISRTRNQTVP